MLHRLTAFICPPPPRIFVLCTQVKIHAESLQQLKVANNKLSSLPAWIATFKSLTTIVLDNNGLTELPLVGGKCSWAMGNAVKCSTF